LIQRTIWSVSGNHIRGSDVTKSALFPEGKMNNRDTRGQQDKKMSKKGRRQPAFSTLDERLTYSAAGGTGSANG
jgi:hypothetical protein